MKMDLEELSRSLQLPMDTLDRWIRQGRIPVRKTDNTCDFRKEVLKAWAERHHIRFKLDPDNETNSHPAYGEKTPESLLSAMMAGGVCNDLEGTTVEEVLKRAVENVPTLSETERAQLFERLIEREKLTSTGIGKGVAIPHPRNPLPGNHESAIITTCFLKNKIEFQSIDHKPVGVLFLMVCPTVKIHLFLLSRISYCLRDESFLALLEKNPSADEFFSMIKNIEGHFEKA
jgi:PTS system nitrogen regulatory IIA component